MIGKGLAVAAQPAALPAAAMPTHRPSKAASHSLAPRERLHEDEQGTDDEDDQGGGGDGSQEIEHDGPPDGLTEGLARQKMFNIIFCCDPIPGRSRDGGRHALFGQAQAAHAPAHPRKRRGGCSTAKASPRSRSARSWRMLGLTHGGFYRHFNDKSELYAEAVHWFLCEEAPKPWQRPRRELDAQVARPPDRRRLLLARPLRRPRELLSADRAAIGRGARRRCA